MADKDRTEKILEDYNDVFADIYNVLLFEQRNTSGILQICRKTFPMC